MRPHSVGPLSGILTAGVQVRSDDTTADLWHTAVRRRLPDCFSDGMNPCTRALIRVRSLAGYAEEELFPAPWLHVQAGLRTDTFVWDVEGLDPETAMAPESTGGTGQRAIASPKLSLISHPHGAVDLFANAGFGFHSNDARSAV